MISMKDFLVAERIRKVLQHNDIRLSETNYKKICPILKRELDLNIEFYDNKSWSRFKQTSNYSELMNDINELFKLGYGCKFISLCLIIKYGIFISSLVVHRRLNKDRLSEVISDKIFFKSDMTTRGRIIYSKHAKSFYLTFKCAKIRDISKKKRIGVKVFFDTENKRVFLERDDRAAKKIILHSKNELYISLYPLPNKIKESLKITDKKTYKSVPIEINLNSNNFGYARYELIDDLNARLLFPHLGKLGFDLEKRRITNASRSEGDLIVYRNNKKIVIEITTIRASFKNSYTTNHVIRDRLIGKITRICLSDKLTDDDELIFILNNDLKKSIINEDFINLIRHFKPDVLFTDFNKGWEKTVAKEINSLLESK